MKKKIFIFHLCYVILLFSAIAQKDTVKPVIKFQGFVKYDCYYDSRLNVDALEGLISLYPQNKLPDSSGNDLNNTATINALSISSRLKSIIIGPDAFRAKTSAYIEFDFTGRAAVNTPASLRFREAWIKLNWKKAELLIGRHWHPLFIEEVLPSVLNMNLGAPFQVFNRSEQFTYKRGIGNIKLISSALFQSDYSNSGPSAEIKSPNYLKWSLIPNLHLQIQYIKPHILTGLALDYKTIRPRLYTTSLVSGKNTYITNERIGTYAAAAFIRISYPGFTFKYKTIYGQNLSEHLLTGGYALKSIDSTTGRETYSPSNNLFLWTNAVYGYKWKLGLFAAYSRNLGFNDHVIGYKPIDSKGNTIENIYGTGNTIAFLYRISPTIIYDLGFLQFGFEFEQTTAAYGDIDFAARGKVINHKSISNNRILFTAVYIF